MRALRAASVIFCPGAKFNETVPFKSVKSPPSTLTMTFDVSSPIPFRNLIVSPVVPVTVKSDTSRFLIGSENLTSQASLLNDVV